MKDFKRLLRFIIVTITVFLFLALLLNIKGYSKGKAFEFSLIGNLSRLDYKLILLLVGLVLLIVILIVVYAFLIFFEQRKTELDKEKAEHKRECPDKDSRIRLLENEKNELIRICSERLSSHPCIEQKELFKTMESKLDKIIELLSGNQGQ